MSLSVFVHLALIQALGLSYQQMGMFTAAVKVITFVLVHKGQLEKLKIREMGVGDGRLGGMISSSMETFSSSTYVRRASDLFLPIKKDGMP